MHSKRSNDALRLTTAEIALGDPETLRILVPAMRGGKDIATSAAYDAFALADMVCSECAKDRAKAQRAFAILSESWQKSTDLRVKGHLLSCACLLGLPRTLSPILEGLKCRHEVADEKLAAGLRVLIDASYSENPRATINQMRDMLRHPSDAVGRFAAEQLALFSRAIRAAEIFFLRAVQDGNRHAASVFLMGIDDTNLRDPSLRWDGKRGRLARNLLEYFRELQNPDGVHPGAPPKNRIPHAERVRHAAQNLHLRLEERHAYKEQLINAARKAVREPEFRRPKQPKPVRPRLRLVKPVA